MDGNNHTGTGADLFLALSMLDEMLCSGGDGQTFEGLPLNELSAVIGPGDLAFIPDFKLVPAAQLDSGLFTARAVGSILVGMAIAEGVILDDETQGYGVRLRAALTPALDNMISQFRECLSRLTLAHLLSSLAVGSVEVGLVT